MKQYFFIFLLVSGCAVESISPSGNGFEMDIDISSANFRHGWAYFTRPLMSSVQVEDDSSIKRGSLLFEQHCQKCHGVAGKEKGPLAEALGLKPTNLRNLAKDLSQVYLLVQIKDGRGSMPQWRDFLMGSQMVDLTNYIRALNTK